MIISLLLFLLHFLFLFTTASSAPPPPSNFTLFGTATVNETTITLAQPLNNNNCTTLTPPPNPSTGRLFYKHPVPFLDSTTISSFSTHFSFTIIPASPPCLSGEGIAFLITSDYNSLPYSLGCMGLPKSLDQNSLDSSSFLAVEFDTNFDQGFSDINDNHVGIDLDSIFSVASIDLMSNGIDLKSGKPINSWIHYNTSNKVIEIWVGYDQVKPESSILTAPIDLSKKFNGFMYVGFSASNGRGGSSVHLIHNWEFQTFDSKSVESAGLGNCQICFPVQERKIIPKIISGLPINNIHSGKRVLKYALGLLGLNVILILLFVCYVVMNMCFKKERTPFQNGPEQTLIPRRLKLSEIRSGTKGFSRNLVIGEGVSATVYVAILQSCGNLNVAVKRFKSGSFGNQFVTEFVTMVGSLRHKNLLKLQGWCCEKNELLLVYDYMPNGSLDKILLDRRTSTIKLSFDCRLNILIGVSSALVYLHEESEQPIIHRNVKSSHVMLDVNFVPKLGGFGMAELSDHSMTTRDVTVPARAMGYLAPEYVYSGVPTVKTDVYSFGVVVLEVASGRPAVDENGVVVTDWVWDMWEEKRLVDGADPDLMGRFNPIDMEMMLMVGLICVHPNYQMRPTMKEVMRMLKGELAPELPAVKPTVMVQSVTSEGSSEVVVRCSGGDDGLTSWGTPKSHFSRA